MKNKPIIYERGIAYLTKEGFVRGPVLERIECSDVWELVVGSDPPTLRSSTMNDTLVKSMRYEDALELLGRATPEELAEWADIAKSNLEEIEDQADGTPEFDGR